VTAPRRAGGRASGCAIRPRPSRSGTIFCIGADLASVQDAITRGRTRFPISRAITSTTDAYVAGGRIPACLEQIRSGGDGRRKPCCPRLDDGRPCAAWVAPAFPPAASGARCAVSLAPG